MLLVDDEPVVCRVTWAMLERLGCNVVTDVDGVEAVTVFEARNDEYRLVILDLSMPRMNGFETLMAL